MLSEVAVELDAWASAQQQAIALAGAPGPEVDHQIFELSLSNPDLPPEVANAIFHSLRAGFCMTAMAHAIAEEQAVEPWLSRALTERLVESIREHLRLLASLPGVSVATSIVPLAARLDLVAIEARHQRARRTARRTYEQARALLGS
jgi:hypothetical protein